MSQLAVGNWSVTCHVRSHLRICTCASALLHTRDVAPLWLCDLQDSKQKPFLYAMLRQGVASLRRASRAVPIPPLVVSTVRCLSTALTDSTPKPLKQAENRDRTWSVSQQPKDKAFVGPRFEQTDIAAQPNRPAAIDLIAQEPIRHVAQRIVACDGGGGSLGHPKVYINLDKPGAHACGYCGVRFELEHSDHH